MSEPEYNLFDEAKVLADDRPSEEGNLLEWALDAEHMIRRLVKVFNSTPQPEQQEPVGEVNRYGLDSHGRKWHGIYWYDPNVDVPHGTKLYTSPQPAQRTWVGLTHDEYDAICDKHSSMSDFDFLEDIEIKLKEKNT